MAGIFDTGIFDTGIFDHDASGEEEEEAAVTTGAHWPSKRKKTRGEELSEFLFALQALRAKEPEAEPEPDAPPKRKAPVARIDLRLAASRFESVRPEIALPTLKQLGEIVAEAQARAEREADAARAREEAERRALEALRAAIQAEQDREDEDTVTALLEHERAIVRKALKTWAKSLH